MPRLVSQGLNAEEFFAQKNGFSAPDHKIKRKSQDQGDHDDGETYDFDTFDDRGSRHLGNQTSMQSSEPGSPRLIEMPDLKFEPVEILKYKMIFNSADKDGSGNVLAPTFLPLIMNS
jgi:hypothetical protein